MTAPTKTPRTDEKIGAFRVVYERDGSAGEAQFTSAVEQWSEMASFARTLETELAAARAEADELARRVGTAEARAKAFMGNLPIYDAALAAAGAIATALRKQGLRICDCGSAPQGICCCGSSSVRAEIEKERGNG